MAWDESGAKPKSGGRGGRRPYAIELVCWFVDGRFDNTD